MGQIPTTPPIHRSVPAEHNFKTENESWFGEDPDGDDSSDPFTHIENVRRKTENIDSGHASTAEDTSHTTASDTKNEGFPPQPASTKSVDGDTSISKNNHTHSDTFSGLNNTCQCHSTSNAVVKGEVANEDLPTESDDDDIQIICDSRPATVTAKDKLNTRSEIHQHSNEAKPAVTRDADATTLVDETAERQPNNDQIINNEQEIETSEEEMSDINDIFNTAPSLATETATTSPRKRKQKKDGRNKKISGIRKAPVKEEPIATTSRMASTFFEPSNDDSSSRHSASEQAIPTNAFSDPVNKSSTQSSARSTSIPRQVKKKRSPKRNIKQEAHAVDEYDTARKAWRCICGHETETEAGMRKHVRVKGTQVAKFKCPLCSSKFMFLDKKMKTHLASEHGLRDLPIKIPFCKICRKVALVKEQLDNHKNERGEICMPRRIRKANNTASRSDVVMPPETTQEPQPAGKPSFSIPLSRESVTDSDKDGIITLQ